MMVLGPKSFLALPGTLDSVRLWILTNPTALKHSRISSGVPRKLYEGSLAQGVAVPRNPMVGSFFGCAGAASGHAATAPPPSKLMNSRRLIAFPEAQDSAS